MMKKTVSSLLWVILLLACTKNDNSRDEIQASIIGQDMALCACCGNWVIEIEGQSEKRQFTALPANSDIDLETEQFPLDVWVAWKEDASSFCQYILIENIRRR